MSEVWGVRPRRTVGFRRAVGFISALGPPHIDARQLAAGVFLPQLTLIKAALCARRMIDPMSPSSQSIAQLIVVVRCRRIQYGHVALGTVS
jgi:hypothetical protein